MFDESFSSALSYTSQSYAEAMAMHPEVAYGVYVTAGRIAIASSYGRDEYDSALTKLSSNLTSYDEITFLVLGT